LIVTLGRLFRAGLVVLLGLLVFACSGAEPSAAEAEFVIAVDAERFVVRSTDPATIVHLREVQQGRRSGFPIGPLRRGDGGFNAPWSWHFDPGQVRVAELAIEVCDGQPSYVEANLGDFPIYCPWGARVVAER
jgi:hypothetical protein